MLHYIVLNTGEESEYNNVRVEIEMRNHRLGVIGLTYIFLMIDYVYAGIGKVWIIERVESIEPICIYLSGTVASKQPATEIDTYFRNHG